MSLLCITFSVGKWAEKLGEELWDLAQTITQREEIKSVSNKVLILFF